MGTKTFHVYQSDGAWTVKKTGKPGRTFSTQREAVAAARKSVKNAGSGQILVHGRNGNLRLYESYRMPPIQEPRKKSPIAAQISRAVNKVILERVKSDSKPPSAQSAKNQGRLHQLSI